MRILHVINSGGVYGAEKMLLNLMEEQRKKGVYPILCSLGSKNENNKPLEIECLNRGIRVYKFRLNHGWNVAEVFKLVKYSIAQKIDVIHSHGYKGDILLSLVPRKLRRIPVVSTLHGWTTSKTISKMAFYEFVHKMCLKNIDTVVTVTHKHKSILKKMAPNIVVVDNAINRLDFNAKIARRDSDFFKFCNGSFIIGSIGRLSPEKGYEVLIKAIKLVSKTVHHAKLVIIGEGKERKNLQSQANSLGIGDRVYLPGYRQNAFNYLPFFEIFVLSSFSEGFPIVLLEAMQAGRPCIGTKVGEVPRILGNGAFGLLAESGNEAELSQLILQLYFSSEARRKFGQLAKHHALSNFSVKRMAQRYKDIYLSLLNY